MPLYEITVAQTVVSYWLTKVEAINENVAKAKVRKKVKRAVEQGAGIFCDSNKPTYRITRVQQL